MPPPLRPHLRSSCRSAPNSLPSVMLPFSVVSTTTSGHACKVAAAAAFDCKATSAALPTATSTPPRSRLQSRQRRPLDCKVDTTPLTPAKPPAPPSRLQRRHSPAHACKAASATFRTAKPTTPRSRLQSRQHHRYRPQSRRAPSTIHSSPSIPLRSPDNFLHRPPLPR